MSFGVRVWRERSLRVGGFWYELGSYPTCQRGPHVHIPTLSLEARETKGGRGRERSKNLTRRGIDFACVFLYVCFLFFSRKGVLFSCAVRVHTHTHTHRTSTPHPSHSCWLWRVRRGWSLVRGRNGQSSDAAPQAFLLPLPSHLFVFLWCWLVTPAQDHTNPARLCTHTRTPTQATVGVGSGRRARQHRGPWGAPPFHSRPEGGKTPRVMARPRKLHHPRPWPTTCRPCPAHPHTPTHCSDPVWGSGRRAPPWVCCLPPHPLAHHQLSLPFCPTLPHLPTGKHLQPPTPKTKWYVWRGQHRGRRGLCGAGMGGAWLLCSCGLLFH